MKKTTIYPCFLLSCLFGGFLLSSCGEKPSEEASTEPNSPSQLEAVFVAEKPPGEVTVSEARKSAKPGDEIVISGKVAGAMNPFTEGFATAILTDVNLKTCDLIPGDECPTPWDACCEDPKVINASRLTIQVLGDDSRPVAESLKGVRGLKELDPLVVTGVVAEGSNAQNMIVNVTGLYQAPANPAH